jgi:hypothetical protein
MCLLLNVFKCIQIRLVTNVLVGDINFNSENWKLVGKDAQMLISSMLSFDPLDRPSVETILQTNRVWLQKALHHVQDDSKVDLSSTLQRLKEWNNMQRFKMSFFFLFSILVSCLFFLSFSEISILLMYVFAGDSIKTIVII